MNVYHTLMYMMYIFSCVMRNYCEGVFVFPFFPPKGLVSFLYTKLWKIPSSGSGASSCFPWKVEITYWEVPRLSADFLDKNRWEVGMLATIKTVDHRSTCYGHEERGTNMFFSMKIPSMWSCPFLVGYRVEHFIYLDVSLGHVHQPLCSFLLHPTCGWLFQSLDMTADWGEQSSHCNPGICEQMGELSSLTSAESMLIASTSHPAGSTDSAMWRQTGEWNWLQWRIYNRSDGMKFHDTMDGFSRFTITLDLREVWVCRWHVKEDLEKDRF